MRNATSNNTTTNQQNKRSTAAPSLSPSFQKTHAVTKSDLPSFFDLEESLESCFFSVSFARILLTHTHTRATADFASMFEYVVDKYGQDVVPLPIAVAIDELALNKMGTRGAKPVYVQIASRKAEYYWSSDNIRCVGFSPGSEVNKLLSYE